LIEDDICPHRKRQRAALPDLRRYFLRQRGPGRTLEPPGPIETLKSTLKSLLRGKYVGIVSIVYRQVCALGCEGIV
jgi:hypothetical protein